MEEKLEKPKSSPKDRSWVASALKELGRKSLADANAQQAVKTVILDERTKRKLLSLVKEAENDSNFNATSDLLYFVKTNEKAALFAINDPEIATTCPKNIIHAGWSITHEAVMAHESCALDIIRNHPELTDLKTETGWSVAHQAALSFKSARLELAKPSHKILLKLKNIHGISVEEVMEAEGQLEEDWSS